MGIEKLIMTQQEFSKHNSILRFIAAIRAAIATRIQCYMFFTILKSLYNTARAYCNSDHIITKIDNYYYDLDGEVSKQEVEDGNYLDLLEHYGENHALGYLYARDGYNRGKIEEAVERSAYNYKEYSELRDGDSPHVDIQLPSKEGITQPIHAKPIRGTQTGSL